MQVEQPAAPSSSLYVPQSVHDVASPPIIALPATQSPHWVSVTEVLGVVMYRPAPHVDIAVQPTTPPDEEYFPTSQTVHCGGHSEWDLKNNFVEELEKQSDGSGGVVGLKLSAQL